MGQAKRRGTLEDRIAQSKLRRELVERERMLRQSEQARRFEQLRQRMIGELETKGIDTIIAERTAELERQL